MKIEPQHIRIEDFDYPLPEDRIAKHPLAQRDASKLLVYRGGVFSETLFSSLPEYIPEDTLLVFNDTKVIQARLLFSKESGSTIEVFCLEPWQMPATQSFIQRESTEWLCFVGNNKRWKQEYLSKNIQVRGEDVCLKVKRLKMVGNAWVVRLSWDKGVTFSDIMETAGQVPLPPYLHRAADAEDKERYQTIYAHYNGSVAAPTAGLHFTDEVFASLEKKHVETEYVTLHVGAGTFKPVSAERIGDHEMHVEKVLVSRAQILHVQQHLQQGKPLIAVGTTTSRTLESVYWFGVQLGMQPEVDRMHINQWFPYEAAQDVPAAQALQQVVDYLDRRGLSYLEGETQLMIAPGYTYRVVQGLITNFHQPKSTLLLLVSALVGDAWKEGYRYALAHGFRFLSYGDSCLFLPVR